MRLLPVYAIAAWLPHVNSTGWRWLVLAAFCLSLAWLLKGLEA